MALTPREQALIRAIAMREGTASELSRRFNMAVPQIRAFAEAYLDVIKEYADNPPETDAGTVTPADLGELWIGNKTERLRRLQQVADIAYDDIRDGNLVGAELATAIREFRSYLMLAANELGQLLHRGSGESGEGSYLSVEINGVDMETLK